MSDSEDEAFDENPTPIIPQRWGATTRALVAGIGLVGIGLFLYWAQTLVASIVASMAIAYALIPFVRGLKRRAGISHGAAVTIIYILALLLAIAAPSLIIPVGLEGVADIIAGMEQIQNQILDLFAQPINLLGIQIDLSDDIARLFAAARQSFALADNNPLDIFASTSNLFAQLLIILVCAYYFLLDAEKLQQWALSLVPTATQSDLRRLIHEIGVIWQSYIGGTLALLIITAITMTTVYLILGLPGAIPLGLFAGFLALIPEIGLFMAGALAVTVAFLLGSSWLNMPSLPFAVVVAAIHIILMAIRASWLEPRIKGRYLALHGGVIFVAVLGGLALQGVLGALAAMPAIATAGIIGHYARCRLFGLNPWETEA